MNKTKIDYVDYTWNVISGCKRGCPYCYGKRIRQRFQPDIPWDELIWYDERLKQPLRVKKPSRILVGSMSDIEYWRQIDMHRVLNIVKQCPQHTFLFLTKNGSVYKIYDFPKNCWIGITITCENDYAGKSIVWADKENIKFLSFEPLLGSIKIPAWINWLIIGAMTGPESQKYQPKVEWIEYILRQADKLNIPVFMKFNLQKIWKGKLRQEFPNGHF